VHKQKKTRSKLNWLRSNGKHLKVEWCGNSYAVK